MIGCIKSLLLSICIVLFDVSVVTNAAINYERCVVLAVTVEPHNIDLFRNLTQKYVLDIWKEPRVPYDDSHVMVLHHQKEDVLNELASLDISWKIYTSNVQILVDKEKKMIKKHRDTHPENLAYDYSTFNEFSEFLPELQSLSADCPADFMCEVYSAGLTHEGNDLNVLHIYKPNEPNRRAYWLDAMMHAREWLAGATHMNIAQKLVREYGTDDEATFLLDSYDWYLLPTANPDGYIYTWTDDRLWRKNRTPNEGSECFGTDLNRNYEYRWGEVGSDDNPCSSTYRGSAPSSEPVTVHLQNEMFRLNDSLNAWITLHTYGQLWMTSWAFNENSPQPGGPCAFPDDYDDLLRVAEAAAGAAADTHGDNWVAGSWCETLYDSSGVLQDHAKAAAGIKYTFTPELRGDGFIVDESQIPLSFQEVWNAIVAMVVSIEG